MILVIGTRYVMILLTLPHMHKYDAMVFNTTILVLDTVYTSDVYHYLLLLTRTIHNGIPVSPQGYNIASCGF